MTQRLGVRAIAGLFVLVLLGSCAPQSPATGPNRPIIDSQAPTQPTQPTTGVTGQLAALSSVCQNFAGNFSQTHRECASPARCAQTGASCLQTFAQQCSAIGASYNGCASACRHEPGGICIQVCVPLCTATGN